MRSTRQTQWRRAVVRNGVPPAPSQTAGRCKPLPCGGRADARSRRGQGVVQQASREHRTGWRTAAPPALGWGRRYRASPPRAAGDAARRRGRAQSRYCRHSGRRQARHGWRARQWLAQWAADPAGAAVRRWPRGCRVGDRAPRSRTPAPAPAVRLRLGRPAVHRRERRRGRARAAPCRTPPAGRRRRAAARQGRPAGCAAMAMVPARRCWTRRCRRSQRPLAARRWPSAAGGGRATRPRRWRCPAPPAEPTARPG